MQQHSNKDIPEIIDALFTTHSEPVTSCPGYAEDIEFALPDETILACRFYRAEKSNPTLLYFPGTDESISDYDVISSSYINHGMNLLLVSYRGCGKSTGTPGVLSFLEDAQFLLQKTAVFLQQTGFNGPLFVMGKSLGSACAIEVASECSDDLKGMIIDSGFCDTLPLLAGLGTDVAAVNFAESDGFKNREKIEKIKLPTLILHGSRDFLIPPAQAEILQASSGARSKQFHIIPGAEPDTMIKVGGELYFQTIKNFVDTTSGINTWRQRRRGYRK